MADMDPLGLFPASMMAQAIRLGQSRFYSTDATGIGVSSATFDPATLINTALSNNNLTATMTTAVSGAGARVAIAKNTGKFYFEIKYVTIAHGATNGVGLAQLATTYTNFAVAAANQLFITKGGLINVNGINTGKQLAGFFANSVAGIAVDLTAHLVWCRNDAGLWNNTAGADPATAVGGLTIPAVSFAPTVCFVGSGVAINDAYTANFGATAYANIAPSSFLNWPSS